MRELGFKHFTYQVPLKVASIHPGEKRTRELSKLYKEGVDVIVSTLERFLFRRNKNHIYLSQCKTIVFDEFDAMMDAGNDQDLHFLMEQLTDKDSPTHIDRQIVFCAATYTKLMKKFIE